MDGRVRALALGRAEHRPGLLVDDDERLRVARAERDARGRRIPAAPHVAGGGALQLRQDGGPLERGRPEDLGVGRGQRPLVRGGEDVAVEHAGRRGVDQRGLRRALEERLRLGHEELVEPVLARDQHGEPARPPSRPPPLLPERRDRPREADRDGAVERADVDPELERVGRRHAEQLALDEAPLDLASLLGRVAGPVGREPPGRRRVEPVAREPVDELRRLAALREADRAEPAAHEPGEQPRRVAERARARAEGGVEELGVPEHDLALGPGRRVVRDDGDVQAGEPGRELARIRDRRRGEHEGRVGAVGERQPPEPAQDVRDVRAEDPPVDVRLVDDDEPEVVERVPPPVVVGKDADVEHVRVREDHVGRPPDVCAPLDRGVPVVDRGPQARHPEAREPARLVLGEGLRRVEEDRAGRRLARDGVEDRQRERERLPRCGPRGDDDAPSRRDGLPGLGLVVVEARHAAGGEPLRDRGLELAGKREPTSRPRGLRAAVGDLAGVEDRVPGGVGAHAPPRTRATDSA